MNLMCVPGKQNLVIKSIQLHMLQSPAFIQSLRNDPFAQPGQVRCMIHPDIYPIRKFLDQWK